LAALPSAIVTTVSVVVCVVVVPLMLAEALESVHVGAMAPGTCVTAQARLTAPLNPPVEVTVMVAVSPVLLPGWQHLRECSRR
jgi:hypothetical protein